MFLRHSAIYVFARGIPGLISFAAIIIYTRLLSPEQYGRYALVAATAMLVNAVLYHWLNGALLRFLPRHQDSQKELLATLFGGFICVSLLVGAGGLLARLILGDPEWTRLVLFSIALIWTQAWFSMNLELARGRLMPVRYGLLNALRVVIALGLGVVLVLWRFGAYGALTGLIAGYCVAGLWASRGQWGTIELSGFNPKLIKSVLVYGLPLGASFALNAVITSTDRFMLAGLIDESATGLYVAGQELARQTIGVSMLMVNLAGYPLAIHALERDGAEAAREHLKKNGILLPAIGLPLVCVFTVLAPDIAGVVLGREFRDVGAALMPWVALAALIAGLRAYFFDLAFFLGRRTGVYMVVMAGAALVNVMLNLRFIPLFGLVGAAYASVTALTLGLVLSAILGRRAFRLPAFYGDAVKLLFCSLVMAGALLFMPRGQGIVGLALSVAGGGFVYLSCIFAVNPGNARKTALRILVRWKAVYKNFIAGGYDTASIPVSRKRGAES